MGFPDKTFDWAICINVIDHTPDPKKMADEIYRVLKPKGLLFFEVNFDDLLSPAHYDLWNDSKVKEVMNNFQLVEDFLERNEDDKQFLYHALYKKF